MRRRRGSSNEDADWKSWLSLGIGFLLGLGAIFAVVHNKRQKAATLPATTQPSTNTPDQLLRMENGRTNLAD